jgi:hypothetical protein
MGEQVGATGEWSAAEDAIILGAVLTNHALEGLMEASVLNRSAPETRERFRQLLFDPHISNSALQRLASQLPALADSAERAQPSRPGKRAVDDCLEEAASHEPRACASVARKARRLGSTCVVSGPRNCWHLNKQLAIVGRRPQDGAPVDIDLSHEGDASRVSRQHAVLEHRPDGALHVRNHGRKPIIIDGTEVNRNERSRITAVSLVEVAGIPLLIFPTTDAKQPPAA